MQIIIDTANIDEIRRAKSLGVLDGITTNPSLIAREKIRSNRKFPEIIREICLECPDLPVSVEVLSTTYQEMVEEGKKVRGFSDTNNIVVKLPCTEDGLRATKALTAEGIATNLTLCFQPLQALLVAKAGATYVSPFVGRLDDQGEDGMQLVANIKMIYMNYGYQTKVLVASVRNPIHILNAARMGADCVTVPLAVISQLMKHPLTDIGVQKFLEDARQASAPLQ